MIPDTVFVTLEWGGSTRNRGDDPVDKETGEVIEVFYPQPRG